MDEKSQAPAGAPMDTPGARKIIPAATDRLRGADRSGLGDRGWAEVPEDRIGHPDDTNVEPEYYEPSSDIEQPKNRPL